MTTFWKVVIALLAIGVVVSLVTLFTGSRPVGSENLIGTPLPDFAAPLASGTQNADANIYTAPTGEGRASQPRPATSNSPARSTPAAT